MIAVIVNYYSSDYYYFHLLRYYECTISKDDIIIQHGTTTTMTRDHNDLFTHPQRTTLTNLDPTIYETANQISTQTIQPYRRKCQLSLTKRESKNKKERKPE